MRDQKENRRPGSLHGVPAMISLACHLTQPSQNLARMLHEGNEVQGKYGKQGWLIARRCIAVAMDQGGSAKIAYRDCRW